MGVLKKTPLKNKQVMLRLNPYAAAFSKENLARRAWVRTRSSLRGWVRRSKRHCTRIKGQESQASRIQVILVDIGGIALSLRRMERQPGQFAAQPLTKWPNRNHIPNSTHAFPSTATADPLCYCAFF